MFKSLLQLTIFSLFGSAVSAYNTDDYIRDHLGGSCNGDTPDCKDFYNDAVELFDQEKPDSPEFNFDINDNHGKLELELD